MSWINDVSYEAGKLEYSIKNLRKFGLTIGTFFGLLGLWFIYSNFFIIGQILFTTLSIILILLGVFFTKRLKLVYRYWMTFAFILGWFVSRFLLTILFFLIIIPIAIIAKLLKKEFLSVNYTLNRKSYWVKKNSSKINYEKMY